MMSSFGPVVALSSLSNNLMQTLASGERVLSLLEEEPQIEEVPGQATAEFADINCENIDFAYEEEQILKDYSISIPKGSRIGIHGKSGSGKSTLLKLLMRFYDVDSGGIRMGDRKLSGINTNELRDMELCDTGDVSVPRFNRQQHCDRKAGGFQRRNRRGSKKSISA